jgi:hypothetical protein
MWPVWPTGFPPLLFDTLGGAAGFLAALLAFVYNSQLDSVLKLGGPSFPPRIEASIRKLFLGEGLLAFILLVVTVALAVMQIWVSLLFFCGASFVIAFAWYQSGELVRFIASLRVDLDEPAKGASGGGTAKAPSAGASGQKPPVVTRPRP